MKKTIILIILIFASLVGCGFSFSNTEKQTKTVEAGKKMQHFVIDISKYARNLKKDFIIIPQNGAELAFIDINPDKELNQNYLNAIDGIGIEELFDDSNMKFDDYRLKMLQKIGKTEKVIVSDVVNKTENVDRINSEHHSKGFISYPRIGDNYHYGNIPSEVIKENTKDILSLKDAENCLYLINSDKFETKELFIKSIEKTNFDLVLIDMFYHTFPLKKEDLKRIQYKKNGGKRILISYINIGAAENWRDYWQPDWKFGSPSWLKKKYVGYDDEIVVEFWNPTWKKIIFGNDASYVKKIIDSGFDGMYLDNVEAYYMLYNKN